MNLFEVAARIVLDTNDYERSVKSAAEQSKKLKSSFQQSAEYSEALNNKLKVLSAQHESARKEVEKLTDAFNKAVKEKGADSNEAQELAKELKKAENAADSLEKEIEDLSQSTEENSKEFDKAGSKVSQFADKLKSGLAAAAKVTAAAIAGTTTAAISLGKAVVSSYSNYEQLEGGVQTLFGTGGKTLEEYAEQEGKSVSAIKSEYEKLKQVENDVLANADKAYASAGMSANEYLETVTSFSAALINSLGGDTAEAAELADKAIIDMSDNMNKMGSDMESIKNAYMGFSKQNYTIKLMSIA